MQEKNLFALTNIPNIKDALNNRYGAEHGAAIFEAATQNLQQLKGEADDLGDEAIRHHFNSNMLPVIAAYKAILYAGIPSAEAKESVGNELHATIAVKSGRYKKLGRLPFAYQLFRLFCPAVLKKDYPEVGWKTEWLLRSGKGLAFNYHSCIYVQTTKALGCPEICELFCQNDDISFGALAPRIIFRRTKTLANGDDCCDFQFLNGHRL